MNIIAVIIQLICGALGGNITGKLLKNIDLGIPGNSLAGILGGLLGGRILYRYALLGVGSQGSSLDLAGIIGNIVSGGVGGGVLMAIIGLIKSLSHSPSCIDGGAAIQMKRKRKIAYVVAAVLAIPAAALTIEIVKFELAVGPQEKLEAECMADAEVAVGEYLRAHSPLDYGEFKSISGEGVYGPTAWSGVGFFIQGSRTVHYANRGVKIRICVFPRHFTQPDNVIVYLVQGDDYLVSHPRLKSRPTIWGFDFW